MTTTYLLDTNIISHMMANADGVAALHATQLLTGTAPCAFCTSIVVQCEIEYGLVKRKSKRLQQAWDFQLASLTVLPLDDQVVTHYARLRTHLEATGQPIGPNDTLIAAHALSMGATLVTADAEFNRVPGLRVENWLTNTI